MLAGCVAPVTAGRSQPTRCVALGHMTQRPTRTPASGSPRGVAREFYSREVVPSPQHHISFRDRRAGGSRCGGSCPGGCRVPSPRSVRLGLGLGHRGRLDLRALGARARRGRLGRGRAVGCGSQSAASPRRMAPPLPAAGELLSAAGRCCVRRCCGRVSGWGARRRGPGALSQGGLGADALGPEGMGLERPPGLCMAGHLASGPGGLHSDVLEVRL